MKHLMIVMVGAVCLAGLVIPARAAEVAAAPAAAAAPVLDPAAGQDEDKWVFNSPLFIWAVGLKGSVSAGGRTVHVDESFQDLIKATDVAFMGYFELAKPRYGFYAQPNYMQLSASGGDRIVKANVTSEMWIVEFGAFYQIWKSNSDRPASLDILAGGRYWSIHNELTLKDPLGSTSGASSSSLFDPILGLRFQEYFTKRFHARVQGDIGGFDLSNSQSRFSYQILPTVGYDFTMPVIKKPSTVFAGWRQINVQHDNHSTSHKEEYNLNFQGVIVGLNVQFF